MKRMKLHNSILPNGTWGPIVRKNLVVNGDAEQNDLLTNNTYPTGWTVSVPGRLSSIAYNNQNSTTGYGKYHFRVTPSYSLKLAVSMAQNISFDEFILLISAGIARYNVSIDYQCSGNQYGYMQLTFFDMNGLTYEPVYRETKSKMQIERLKVSNQFNREMHKVQLKVGFIRNLTYDDTNTNNEENYCIADNIRFFITKIN
ncbi:unnamed protein product [Adineta ricciae]|uniref:Uncharacterized protein n=1 Tax=Adineta ricciae TaxID=249248 RepID=A0A816DKV9_ADIRI|nr:unnamed protein product [Adineta ricciae]